MLSNSYYIQLQTDAVGKNHFQAFKSFSGHLFNIKKYQKVTSDYSVLLVSCVSAVQKWQGELNKLKSGEENKYCYFWEHCSYNTLFLLNLCFFLVVCSHAVVSLFSDQYSISISHPKQTKRKNRKHSTYQERRKKNAWVVTGKSC